MEKPARAPASRREDYRWFKTITTRWADNDVYGHINNVTYYAYFDTAVNAYLIETGALRIGESPVIGLVVETRCRFLSPLSFPGDIDAGLRVARIGTSSVTYEIGIFGAGADTASAEGHFVHVYVDAATRRPCPLPEALGSVLKRVSA
jgi:acyl-CoA thioester hydrolase